MNKEELNIKYICDKTLLDKNDELVPIILEMIKDSYKSGLNQAEYDNTMDLINENKELKTKNSIIEEKYKIVDEINQKYKEIIDKAIEYIENNSDIYLNIMGNKIGFFNKHDDGYVPIELLDILKEVE